MIDDAQSCLAYYMDVRMISRLYGCIIVLKCIFLVACVMLHSKIYTMKLLVLIEVCNLQPCDSFSSFFHEISFSII